jgi:polar amino acid transport system substrate-binding protein
MNPIQRAVKRLTLSVACSSAKWPVTLLVASFALVEAYAADGPPLRVGVTPHYPPLIYKEAGQLAGIEPDFARALGKELSRPVQFVELEWEEQIPALVEGRTDIIMSSMSITTARQLRVAFTRPYLGIGQKLLVRREDLLKYIEGMPMRPSGAIGVLAGTTGDFLVQQEFPKSKRKTFNSSEDAAKALVKKKIDLFITDSPTVWWLAGMNESSLAPAPILLTQEQLAWAVRRTDQSLLDSVNTTLEKMQKNGQANALLKRWIPNLQ